jgi:hypothetical protein
MRDVKKAKERDGKTAQNTRYKKNAAQNKTRLCTDHRHALAAGVLSGLNNLRSAYNRPQSIATVMSRLLYDDAAAQTLARGDSKIAR